MNKKQIEGRCNYRNWPIRRQLMISFLSTTIFLQLIIICVIFVILLYFLSNKINLNTMKEETNSKVYKKVNNRTQSEFLNIAIELGNSFQAHLYQLSSVLEGFKEMFIQVNNPLNSDLYQTDQTQFKQCNEFQSIDFTQYCLFIPQDSSQNMQTFNKPIQEILQQMSYYNQFLPRFYTPYLQYQIKQFRLFLEDPSNLIYILMVYPAQPIADDYLPLEEYWLLKAQDKLDHIVLTGPQIDNDESKLYLTQALNYDKQLANDIVEKYRVYFQIQITVESLSQLFTELNYLATSENIIYAPNYWKTNYKTRISKIFEYPQFSGINLETQLYPNTTIQMVKKQMEFNSTQYEFEMLRVPLSGTFKSAQLSSFLNDKNVDAQLDTNTQTFIFMYGQQEEMLQIYTLISTIIQHEETVIILLTMCSCINTVAIVFIFTYMVAVKISRPLRKLINSAAHMSSSASSKNVTSKILHELDQIEAQNQIEDLIQAFKNLVRTIEQRNNTQKSTAKQQIIQYPLNQYDPEFISKARGVSDINWHDVINEIEDE